MQIQTVQELQAILKPYLAAHDLDAVSAHIVRFDPEVAAAIIEWALFEVFPDIDRMD